MRIFNSTQIFILVVFLTSCVTIEQIAPVEYPIGSIEPELIESGIVSFRKEYLFRFSNHDIGSSVLTGKLYIVKHALEFDRGARTLVVEANGKNSSWKAVYVNDQIGRFTITLLRSNEQISFIDFRSAQIDSMTLMPHNFLNVKIGEKKYNISYLRDFSRKFDGAVLNPSSQVGVQSQKYVVYSPSREPVLSIVRQPRIEQLDFAEGNWKWMKYSGANSLSTKEYDLLVEGLVIWIEAAFVGHELMKTFGNNWNIEKIRDKFSIDYITDLL